MFKFDKNTNAAERSFICSTFIKFSRIWEKFCTPCKCSKTEEPGVVLTGFFRSLFGTACSDSLAPNIQAYHTGAGALPDIGDFVFSDLAGTTPVAMGNGQWMAVATASSNTPILGSIYTDGTGQVTTFNCK